MTTPIQTRASWDVRYAAGFFDGEGCVNITKATSRNKYPLYRLQASLTNTNAAILDWFQEHRGGKIYEVSNNRSSLTEYPRTCLALWWNGRDAGELLRELEPFLRVKGDQARNAIAFQALKDSVRPHGIATPPDIRAKLARFHDIHTRLSSRGRRHEFLLEAIADDVSDQLELLS